MILVLDTGVQEKHEYYQWICGPADKHKDIEELLKLAKNESYISLDEFSA